MGPWQAALLIASPGTLKMCSKMCMQACIAWTMLPLALMMGATACFRAEEMQGYPGVGKLERNREKKQKISRA